MATTTAEVTFYTCDDPKCAARAPGYDDPGAWALPMGWTKVTAEHHAKNGTAVVENEVFTACRPTHVKGAILAAIDKAAMAGSKPFTDEDGDDDPLFDDEDDQRDETHDADVTHAGSLAGS